VRAAIATASARLRAAGVASPRNDAELLAAHVLDITRGRLLLVESLTEEQRDRFDELVAARERRVPLQHIIGSVTFGHIDFEVGPGVFTPRPETEQLVEWAFEALGAASAGLTIVDFCSGTGAIALSMAYGRPGARVIAVEREATALRWLRRNASAHKDTPIVVVEADVTAPSTLADLDGGVDMLLCNPPYVPDATQVPYEVRADPHVAVFGGNDGLDVIRPVITQAARLLKSGGWLGFEHDESHADKVGALIAASGAFGDIELRPDLAGRQRFTTARRLER
jgi:release factor glutamine methyltransferase